MIYGVKTVKNLQKFHLIKRPKYDQKHDQNSDPTRPDTTKNFRDL